MSENIYYVYQYWDPLRKEPIYIGKGCGKRAWEHLQPYRLKSNHPFKNRIKWLKKQNKSPIVSLLYINLSEEKSFKLERKIIKKIGRKDLGKGPLLNLTDGGQGMSGHRWDQEQIKNNSGKNNCRFGTHLSKEVKNKISKAQLGIPRPKESIIKRTITRSKEWLIIFPNKEKQKIKNLNQFCRENNLNQSHMVQVAKGNYTNHKGFKCKNLNPLAIYKVISRI